MTCHHSEQPRTNHRYGKPTQAPGTVPKEAPAPKNADYSVASAPSKLPAGEQQLLRFLSALSAPTIKAPGFKDLLQAVKGELYNKEYEAAFGTEERREAYAARWVPSRAVIYRRILRESEEIRKVLERREGAKVLLLGGGAGSELIAVGAVLSGLLPEGGEGGAAAGEVANAPNAVEVSVIDSSDWSNVIARQQTALVAAYHNLSTHLSVSFTQGDILDLPASTAAALPHTHLVTILFTVTELLLQSRARTLAFFSTLSACAPGTLLLIVESASLAVIPVGTGGRTYPLATLLDHALAGDKSREDRAKWDEVQGVDERWYRMAGGAEKEYPLKLEGSRVVLRLYRRV